MSNPVGVNDNFLAAGLSAAWNSNGELINQLKTTEQGLLIIDLTSNEMDKKILF